jgi:hypothetical protein
MPRHNHFSYLNSILVEHKRLQDGKVWNDYVEHVSVWLESYETKLSRFDASRLLSSQYDQRQIFLQFWRSDVVPREVGHFGCNREAFLHEFGADKREQKHVRFQEDAKSANF